jgi:hypothetical protein
MEYKDPYKYLRASEARRQVAAAPARKIRLDPKEGSTSKRKNQSKYPKHFGNKENLKVQATKPDSINEYPMVREHGGVYDQRDREAPGPSRAVYNNHDRTKFDIVYHNEKKSPNWHENMDIAPYRPSRR